MACLRSFASSHGPETNLYKTAQYVDIMWPSNICVIEPFHYVDAIKAMYDCEDYMHAAWYPEGRNTGTSLLH